MNYTQYLTLFISLVLTSCASQIPLSGGSKDQTPPVVVASTPDITTNTNYSKNYISFEFQEPIQVNNISSELTIQPHLPYDYTIKKKTLIIHFKDTLRTNTTYSVNLGSSIKDITEGNIAHNITHYFTTGNTLDSNQINGTIQSNYSSKASNCLVGLYPDIDSVTPQNTKPIYYVITSTNHFEIPHLPKSKFKIYAFTDHNNNKLWEPLKELIAFQTLSIQSPQQNISLQLSCQDSTSIKHLSTRNHQNGFVLTFNRSIKDFNLHDHSKYYSSLHKEQLFIYPKSPVKDSSNLILSITDSLDHRIEVSTQLIEPFKITDPKSLIQKIAPINRTLSLTSQKITLFLAEPINIKQLHSSEITLNDSKPDSIEYHYPQLHFFFNLSLQDTNLFTVPKNSVPSTYHISNDSINTYFLPFKSSNFGNLSGSLSPTPYPKIIQLLDQKSNIVLEQYTLSNKYFFKNIDPGKYQLRIIHDTNSNQRYDNGNFYSHIPPEKIEYFNKELQIRANWDLESINIP